MMMRVKELKGRTLEFKLQGQINTRCRATCVQLYIYIITHAHTSIHMIVIGANIIYILASLYVLYNILE